ncbi:hypothetical protein GCM10011374_39700 [Kocuria dechangensis]|uniref:Uncharacterized protein n=1 Tax=Kocuria dechangensis TaxID=1176249 RepID=A0A917H916_9MICC|nr:hypothetical protein GCM10011374_39700 [Kocuria dechangensis]
MNAAGRLGVYQAGPAVAFTGAFAVETTSAAPGSHRGAGRVSPPRGLQGLALTAEPAQGNNDTAECPVMVATPVDRADAEAAGL